VSGGQHRLVRVQLVNWGTFQGYVDIPVPRSGLLLTGPSGSGKSSVIDAIGAVLVQPKWLAFNAAAQEGGKGDQERNLATYIRGAYKKSADEVSGEVGTAFLRTGATWSGIGLTYDDGEGAVTTLIRLMHLAKGTNAVSDVSSYYLMASEDPSLMNLAPYVENGMDKRGIKRDFANWQADDSNQSFAHGMRKRLSLASEQAQHLLHKTQSAKSLSSLDALFRDFMLDEPPTFATAKAAVEQFGELKSAHSSVVDARNQVEVLSPLKKVHADRRRLMDERAGVEVQSAHLPTMLLHRKSALTSHLLDDLQVRLAGLRRQLELARQQVAARQADRDAARDHMLGLGGQDLETLQQAADRLKVEVAKAETELARRQQQAAECGLTLPVDELGMSGFQVGVEAALGKVADTPELREQLRQAVIDAAEARKQMDSLRHELDVLISQRSNIEPWLLEVRDNLVELGVPVEQLPFASELVEVRADEAEWTGAIERVLRTFARTLLVPDQWYPLVSDYVDSHVLSGGGRGVHLRYNRVLADDDAPAEDGDERMLWRKVAVTPGEFERHVNKALRRFDYLCVESSAELRGVSRGVTRAGQVKHSKVRHEKDDRFEVGDRRQWVLGSSTDVKQAALQADLAAAETRHDAEEAAYQLAEDDRGRRQHMAALLAGLAEFEWNSIDVAGASRRHDEVVASIARLRASSVGLEDASQQFDQADQSFQAAMVEQQGLISECDGTERRRAELADQLTRFGLGIAQASAVPDEVAQRLREWFEREGDDADETARHISTELSGAARRLTDAINRAEQTAVKAMTEYRGKWSAESSDLTIEIDDMDGYLDILKRLESDRLPEFEERFFDLLQTQSRNNVGVIRQQLNRARKDIRDRVAPINESLRQTAYQPGGYLFIRDEDRRLPEVAKFLSELNEVTAGSLEDSFGPHVTPKAKAEAERRFAKLQAMMDRLQGTTSADRRWVETVLDSRQHVQFTAEVRDVDGNPINYFKGAGGLSGGERQKLVAFCLAAALRYQLVRGSSTTSGYGLVVLDEAFDKTDPDFTRMSLDVFATFGFQLLLVTPEKMLQIMEDYVGGVAVVHMSDDPSVGSLIEVLPWEDEPIVPGDGDEGAGADVPQEALL